MKLQRNFLTSLVVFFVASAPNTGSAEDIDIYLKSPSIERDDAANVLIIFDTSSSMPGHLISSNAGYDPSTTYVYAGAGIAFDPTKIYWRRNDGSQPAEPVSADTYSNQNFDVANNRCKNAGLPWHVSPTDQSGYATVRAAMFVGTGNWTGMSATNGVVDCKPDHDDDEADEESTGLKWLKSNSNIYTSSSSQKFSWGGTNVTLYSGNYLNYKSLPTSVIESRLTVAKRVVNQIFDANPGVKFGLMLFNRNNSTPHGGYFPMRIGRLSEGVTYKGLPNFPRLAALKDIVDNINTRPFPTSGTAANHTCNPAVNAPIPASCGDTSLPFVNTPLAESMWEAKQYFTGSTPTYGYPASTPVPLPDQDAKKADGTYESPFGFSCQKAFIIYITDGSPTNDTNANASIAGLTNIGTFNPAYPNGLTSSLDELARWMATQDLIPDNILQNKQQVVTYTIGFDLDITNPPSADAVELLQDTASKSGGQFFAANNADELQNTIQGILIDVTQTNTSFVAPSLSINAFNRLFHRDEIYFALFKPSATVAWNGNVKKFKLKADATTTDSLGNACVFGDVIDQNDVCAIDPVTARIKDSALSFWGTVADGGAVTEGGAGAQIPAPATRKVYTYRGAYTGLSITTPATPVLLSATAGNAFYDAAINDPTIIGLADTSGSPADTNTADTTEVTKLIDWMLGQDSYDKDQDGAVNDDRWAHADPLHSRPVAVGYGGTSTDPVIKLFYAGNDGAIHMVNDKNGKEEWVFLPQEILDRQFSLSQDPAGAKIHGVDGTPTFWIHDDNNDGIIQPGTDWVRMFINMRRGGRNIYAFDVTPSTVLTDPAVVGGITPKLMWVIRGGVDSDYMKLGQTWSNVLIEDIRFGTATPLENIAKTVVIFGGGYDANEEDVIPVQALPTANAKIGNAIYIVDPADGSRLWWASDGPDSLGAAPTLALPKMKFSIPSDLALMDSNGDEEIDRIFVGDTGGQLWRIDLGETLKANTNAGSVGYVFADVGCEGGSVATDRPNCTPTTNSNRRKFFYPPDVAAIFDTQFVGISGIPRYDLVAIASGDREDPLDLLNPPGATAPFDHPVHNRMYAFRDVNVDSLQGLPSASLPAPLVDTDLYDATANDLQDPSGAGYAAALGQIQTSKGWRVDLKEIGTTAPAGSPVSWPWVGEKGLSRVVIFDSKIFATTYVPPSQQTASSTCDPSEGLGRLYGFNYLDATAAYDFDKDGNYTASDRALTVGGGIPSDPVIIIREGDPATGLGGTSLGVGTGGGMHTEGGLDLNSRSRTFWYQK